MTYTYNTAKKHFQNMTASYVGAVCQGLDFDSLSNEERNKLSANWGKKINRFSNRTMEELAVHFPNIMISDQALAKMSRFRDFQIGANNTTANTWWEVIEENTGCNMLIVVDCK